MDPQLLSRMVHQAADTAVSRLACVGAVCARSHAVSADKGNLGYQGIVASRASRSG